MMAAVEQEYPIIPDHGDDVAADDRVQPLLEEAVDVRRDLLRLIVERTGRTFDWRCGNYGERARREQRSQVSSGLHRHSASNATGASPACTILARAISTRATSTIATSLCGARTVAPPRFRRSVSPSAATTS